MSLKTKLLSLSLVFAALTAVADDDSAKLNDKLTSLNGTIQSINGELSSQKAQIGSMKVEIAALNDTLKKQLLKELKAMQRQNQYLYDTLMQKAKAEGESDSDAALKPISNYDLQTPDNKMILGEAEFFYVKQADATLSARIDTGASLSSITATNITEFERNGKKYMKFDIVANDRTIEVEAPFVRQIDIRQSSRDEVQWRPSVRLTVKIGQLSTKAEFTLVDRAKLNYPLLIGRNVITDIAVVDVSRSYIQPRADMEGLVLIDRDTYKELKKKNVNINQKYDEAQELNNAGKLATPAQDSGTYLGTDPEKSMTEVTNKVAEREGTKPEGKLDVKTPDADKADAQKQGDDSQKSTSDKNAPSDSKKSKTEDKKQSKKK